MLQRVAACGSALQCVAVCFLTEVTYARYSEGFWVLLYVAMWCSELHRVAVCCSVDCTDVKYARYSEGFLSLFCVAVCSSVLQCVAACGSALQCVAVCCSVLQCVFSLESHMPGILSDFGFSCMLQCGAVSCTVLQCGLHRRQICQIF